MQQSFDIYFASSNKNKYLEAKKILENFGIKVGFYKCNLVEIQADSIKEIAYQKTIDAFLKCKKPVIIEDDGLFINSLNEFPGPYSSFVFKTIGNNRILKLVGRDRNAKFQSVIGFCDKKKKPKLFEANVRGKISTKLRGTGWGYDPIFVPKGKSQTYAELSDKNELSHRYQGLKKFANWYLNKKKSTYR